MGDAREGAALGDASEGAALGDTAFAAFASAAAVGDAALDAAFGDVATVFAGDVLLPTAGNRIGSVSAIRSFFYKRSPPSTPTTAVSQ